MKSASLGTILGLLSLAGVGVLYFKIENLSDQLRPLTQGRADAPRHGVRGGADDAWDPDPPAMPAPDDEVAPGRGDASKAAPKRPARRAELENRIAHLEREQAKMKKDRGGFAPVRFRGPKFARSVEQLARSLKLTKGQEARIRQIADQGKARIEQVLKIPDESGVSPYERRQERQQKIQEAMKTGNWKEVTASVMGSMGGHRKKRIPGSNTTYGEEIDRIKKETRQDIASNLNEDQKKAFEDTRIDPMLGDSHGAVSVAYVATAGEPGVGGGIIETEGIEIVTRDDEATEDDE